MKQRVKILVAGGLLVLALFGVTEAGQLEDGEAAYQRGDYATMLRLFRPLAEQGDAKAQTHLGLMYERGEGVPQDDKQAVMWYRKAADQGNARAQLFLGAQYDSGQGVPQDYAQAAFWYSKAASQGYEVAQMNLGGMYEGGRGVAQNYVLAHMWYNLATSANFSDRIIRDALAAKMTPDQIAEAQRMARDWVPK